MGGSMRQIEIAAQRVAELVMQAHRYRAEHHAAQPGRIPRVTAGLRVLRVRSQPGVGRPPWPASLPQLSGADRAAIVGVQRLGGMGDDVAAAGDRDPQR